MNKIKTKCSEVTLDEFIDCLLNGNYSRLGEGTESELNEAWETLYGEYCNLSGNKAHAYYFSVSKKYYLLQTKLVSLKYCLGLPPEEMFAQLKKLGYKGNDLNKILTEAKRQMIELETAKKDFDKLQQNDGKQTTEKDFISWIVAVSKYMNFHIDRKVITVAEFLEMSQNMENEIKINSKNK